MHRSAAIVFVLGCTREPPDSGRVPGPDHAVDWTIPAPATSSPADPGPTRVVNDRDFLPAALEALYAARSEIRVAQYVIYDGSPVDTLVAALIEAAERGVRVRVLADEEGDETEAVLDLLERAGVEAALDSPATVLHSKLIVADDVVLVGSHNWTASALEDNHEASILVVDPEVAAWYAAWFDALLEAPDADPAVSPLDRTDLRPVADRAVLDALLACIEEAEERIEAVVYAIAWDDRYPGSGVDRLLSALEDAHARGVDVRIGVDGSDWIADNAINDAAVARLRGAGIAVWTAPAWVTTHAKVLSCDERVIVGDTNWSYSGIELYHGTSLDTSLSGLVQPTVAWIGEVKR